MYNKLCIIISFITMVAGLHVLRLTPGNCNDKKLIDSTRGVIVMASVLFVFSISQSVCNSSIESKLLLNNKSGFVNIFLVLAFITLFSLLMVLYTAIQNCDLDDDVRLKQFVMTLGFMNLALIITPVYRQIQLSAPVISV